MYTVVIQYVSWVAMETVRFHIAQNDFFPHIGGPSAKSGTHEK